MPSRRPIQEAEHNGASAGRFKKLRQRCRTNGAGPMTIHAEHCSTKTALEGGAVGGSGGVKLVPRTAPALRREASYCLHGVTWLQTSKKQTEEIAMQCNASVQLMQETSWQVSGFRAALKRGDAAL